jgi:flavin reductase (DIM6/NTAB) family NADH-FMN oxidoreductase RutF
MSIDARQLRDALGCFGTGVCLVTAVDDGGRAQALTINSFASVSLDPPLVLWSLQNSSDAFALYSQAPRFAIAVLSSEQEPLSNRYAVKGSHELDPAHFDIGENGAPLIRGALVNLECSLENTMPGGDHRILLGHVTRLVPGPEGPPLLFHGGRYRQLA